MKGFGRIILRIYNLDTYEQVVIHICGFYGVQGGNYFRVEPVRRSEVEARVRKLRNGRAARKDEISGELVKSGVDVMVDSIWGACNSLLE